MTGTASAALVTWNFTGTLSGVTDLGGHTALMVGDSFTIEIQFETGAADSFGPSDTGIYDYGVGANAGLFGSMTVNIDGGAFVDSTAFGSSALSDLEQRVVNLSQDTVRFVVADRGSVSAFSKTFDPFTGEAGFSLDLTDDDGTIVSSDALLIVPPSLADLESAEIDLRYKESVSGDSVFLHGDLQSVTSTVIPVPAAVWLFGSALAMMGWLRRR